MTSQKLNSILKNVQKPGQYLGNEVNVIKKDFEKAAVRVCLIFPDKYEIGLSHIGLKILYEILNQMDGVVCERAYAPDMDMDAALKESGLSLFSLESKKPLKDFDLLGFSFTYELTYTNFLNILKLSHIPLRASDRSLKDPLILGGGGGMMNAEPIADFLDAAVIGDGEEIVVDIVQAIKKWKQEPLAHLATAPAVASIADEKLSLLNSLSEITGIYVPSFFVPHYHEDGTLCQMEALKKGYTSVSKRVVDNLDAQVYPTKILVPHVKLVHDRVGIEIQRGCNRACRFCQAGYIDRPVRQRSPQKVLDIAETSLKQTGIEDLSLLSLSAADYGTIVPLMTELNDRYAKDKISISVPATRTEKLTPELIEQIKRVRKTGFTIAPEAGTERMRRVINKGNKVDDLFTAVTNAFSAGWQLLKLYYMVGLPFEHDEDVLGIAHEANESIKICLKYSKRSEINLSASSFVPKPHTPFQWDPQMSIDESRRRYNLVRHNLENRRIRFKTHHPEMSYIEGILSRGDRRVSTLLELALEKGCIFDEWDEHFDFQKWQAAFKDWDGDPDFYVLRKRSPQEVLPWDHLFEQMNKEFLWDEYLKAKEAAGEQDTPVEKLTSGKRWKRLPHKEFHDEGFTEDCSVQRCSNCGVCDYKTIKNKTYVVGEQELVEKKAHRVSYGWTRGKLEPREAPFEPDFFGDQPSRLRVRFSKNGLGAMMGHLELMGFFKRVIRRLKLPVLYSEGFRPKVKMAMGYPLPLGIESDWEFFDLDVMRPKSLELLKNKMNEQMADGLEILSIDFIDRKTPSLYSSVSEFAYAAKPDSEFWSSHIKDLLKEFNDGKEIVWTRENKKGKIKSFNLSQSVKIDLKSFPDEVVFRTVLDPEGSLSPQDVLITLFGMSREEAQSVQLKKVGMRWKD